MVLGLGAPLLAAAPSCAQAVATGTETWPSGTGAPQWLDRWSPLRLLGDLPRELPVGNTVFPSLLTLPAPRVGLLWTSGNPAAAAHEVHDSRVDFRLERARSSGEYRRPLDPGEERHWRLGGLGWRELGEDGAVIGRVVVDRGTFEEAHFDVIAPYGSNPFVVLDTLGDALDRTAVRIEGAGGWSLGRLGLGLGLGYEAQETRTQESNVPRLNRTATPGFSGGLSYVVSGDRVQVGLQGRWQQTAQSLSVFSIGAPSRVYELRGYQEPTPLNLSALAFQRRLERTAWGLGGGVSVRFAAWRLTAFAGREWLSEGRFSTTAGDSEPLTDQWDTRAWRLGGAGQLAPGPFLVTVEAGYAWLEGEGQRADLPDAGVTFTADESTFDVSGELRYVPAGPWELAGRFGFRFDSRERLDEPFGIGVELDSWTPGGSIEVARQLGRRLALALGAGLAAHSPNTTTPDPTSVGPAYERWISPEFGLTGTDAVGWAGTAVLSAQVSSATQLFLQARYRSASPRQQEQVFPDSPSGDRDGLALVLGLIM